MKISELKEYLNTFPDDAPVSIVCANPRKRKVYEPKMVLLMSDEEFKFPALVIDIKNERNMTEEERRACEDGEQVRRCGNAVCPPIPAALVRANLAELCVAERMPNIQIEAEQTGQLRFA